MVLRRLALTCLLVLTLASPAAAVTFTTSDLQGDWFIRTLEVSGVSGLPALWTIGDLAIDATGAVLVGMTSSSNGHSATITDGLFTINAGGNVVAAVVSDSTPVLVGVMLPSKDAIVLVSTTDLVGPAPVFGMVVLVRASPALTFQTNDLDAVWRLRSLRTPEAPVVSGPVHSPPSPPSGEWATGSIDVNGTGDVTGGSLTFPNGRTDTILGGTLTMQADGTFTGTVISGTNEDVSDVHAVMLPDFNTIVGVFSLAAATDGLGMFLLQRTPTASFATSDMAGTWNLNELHVFENEGNVGAWTFGTLVVNAAGTVTGGVIVAPDGSFHNPTGGSFTITTGVGGGEIVGTINTATATITARSIMHGTKDLIFGVDTTVGASVTHGLVVLSKVPDANPSTLQFNSATYTVSEAAGSVTVRVTRTGSTTTAASVAYTTVPGTACSCSDFGETAGVLTFPAGETFQDITVPIIDNTVVDGSRNFTVVLSSPAGATLGSPSTTTVTITNNDAAGSFRFAATSYSVTEGGTVKARIQRTAGPGMALASGVSVTYSVLPSSTATNGVDYTVAGGTTLTFAAGESFRDVTISALNDTLTEGPETIQLMLVSSNIGSIILPKTTTVTIADVVPSRIQFAISALSVPESAGTVPVVVTRTGGLASAVFVPLSYGGTAIVGTDYAAPPGGLTFVPGHASATIPITVLNDTLADGDRTLVITLGTPGGGGVLGTPRSMTLTMIDDEASIQFTGRYRGNSPEVRRTGNLAGSATVHYQSTGGTATSGVDFVPLNGNLTFGPGVSLQYIPLVILSDNIAEGTETMSITLSNAQPAASVQVGPFRTLNVNIKDDDFGGRVQFEFPRYTAAEGTIKRIKVVRAGGLGTVMTVRWERISGTATPGTDFHPSSGTLTFGASDTFKTFTLTITSDAAAEGPETIRLGLTVPPDGAASLGTNATTLVTIPGALLSGAID